VNDPKYIGLDVHQATISAAVLDSAGKLVMESILETKAATVLQFIQGLRGSLHVTFEEGTCAAWLHDLLKPHVTKVLVCDPRKNSLLKAGNKNDRMDARRLADLKSETTAPHRNTGLVAEISSRRRGSVFLDIPFYRTGLSVTGFSWPEPHCDKPTSWELALSKHLHLASVVKLAPTSQTQRCR
jgi:hypothetical protein